MGRKKITSNELTLKDVDVIKSLAKNNLNQSATARDLYYGTSTVGYIIGRIKAKTKLNPLNFYDMVKLLEMVNGGRSD